MLSLFRSVLALAGCALTVGCAGLANKAGPDRIAAADIVSAEKGIVILSAGAPDFCRVHGTALVLRNFETKKFVDTVPMITVDSNIRKTDFDDHFGTVNALALPPGLYLFTPWLMHPDVAAVYTPSFEFEVKSGEITYLGEVFMTRSCGFANRFEIRDRYDRDMAMVSVKNAVLATRPVVKRLLVLGPRVTCMPEKYLGFKPCPAPAGNPK